MLRLGRPLCLIFMLAACSASTPIGEPSNSSIAQAASPSAASPTPTARPTATPTQRPTPEPSASLNKVGQWVYAWKSFAGSSYVSYQVIVEVVNEGNGWAELAGFSSDYTILSPSGGVTATGRFIYEYPKYLGPGETGYLVEDSSQDGVTVDAFASVDVSGRYDQSPEPDITFEVSDIVWRNAQFSDGLTATGFLTATGGDAESVSLAVLCIGDDGSPLGATTTNLIQNVTDGVRKGFETVSETPPLSASQCASTVGFAETPF